jgi:hypothetical protein
MLLYTRLSSLPSARASCRSRGADARPLGREPSPSLASRCCNRRPSLAGDLMALGAGILWGATTLIIKGTRLRATEPAKVLLY